MMQSDLEARPQDFWQELHAPGRFRTAPEEGHRVAYPAVLPDGRQLLLPIRVRDEGRNALASLILNQASFEVVDALAEALAEKVKTYEPDVVVGLPTLGLTLAASLARALGHSRYVPLGTSRKFWYDESRSVPMRSVTSPDQQKRLYVDPRMMPLIEGRRVLLVDDVISSGTSIVAGLRLMKLCGIKPVAIAAAMLQTERWKPMLEKEETGATDKVVGVFKTPLLRPNGTGGWVEEAA
ncbi:phosphoribosyltransferase [Nitratireductor basaltis]|uniref:Phosphoribosyltransferase n=1 Tax=Nitratireductor basaltis TaxID=472175 RepID=A0A084U517_9HYPH|nr:phosphoribosyltransferase [Nitratireductor basaltis]KFB08053.1 Phosphoribosyltransferase [Nitratireductor basaltis]